MTEKNKTDNIAIYILLNIIFLYRGYKGKRKEEMEEMNMKKRYERPMMNVETFVCDEYVSSCTDTVNKYYEFVCDAGGGAWADIYEGAYPDGTNLTPDGFLSTGYFHACGEEHYVKQSEANFTTGWYDSNEGSGKKYEFDVVIWKGIDGDDVHATRALHEDIKLVEGNKS